MTARIDACDDNGRRHRWRWEIGGYIDDMPWWHWCCLRCRRSYVDVLI